MVITITINVIYKKLSFLKDFFHQLPQQTCQSFHITIFKHTSSYVPQNSDIFHHVLNVCHPLFQ
jgi:hypothetical protein